MTKANNDTKSTHESMTDNPRGRSTVTRRLAMNMILGTAIAAAGTVALATPAASTGPDPIFARIATHKKLTADWQRLYDRLDESEWFASKEHGNRPIELIHWRHYHIGASEIDSRRESLLEAGEVEPATVEQEYIDAKARYQAQIAAGLAWDKTTGLETLRKDVDRRSTAEWRYAKRLARTMPTTPAGVAALIQYIMDNDLVADESYWHMTALRSAVAGLNSMGVDDANPALATAE
jgi:hypothetical protein